MPATKTRGRKSNNKTETLTIEWILQDKGLVKFSEKSDDTFDLSDKVTELDLGKFGIGEGTVVEAQFDKNDVVVFLKKVKGETRKTETTNNSDNAEVKKWTIAGIPASKEVIKFKEDEKTWYPVDKKVQDLDFESLGIKARATVEVTFGKTKKVKGKEVPVITYVKVVKDTNTEKGSSKSSGSSSGGGSYGDRNTSIERQCAWKGACDVVGQTLDSSDVDEVQKAVTQLAEAGIKFIQG